MLTPDSNQSTGRSRQGKAKELFWRKTLARLEESRLTQVEFCKRERLNPNNLAWWKREIAIRDAAAGKEAGKAIRKNHNESQHAYWRAVLSKFDSSGLSKDDFCAQEGIKPGAFCWWRGELERCGTRKKPDYAEIGGSTASPEVFVPLSIAESSHPAAAVEQEPLVIAEVDVQTGRISIFDTATDSSLLTLLRAIRGVTNDRQHEQRPNLSVYSRHGYAQEF
jgi:hypothetical protein